MIKYFLLLVSCATCLGSPASDARTKARPQMEQYRKGHPVCEWCSRTAGLLSRLEVHHVIPVSIDIRLAADTNNMVTLCRPCHIVLGHNNDGGCRRYVANVKEIVRLKEVK